MDNAWTVSHVTAWRRVDPLPLRVGEAVNPGGAISALTARQWVAGRIKAVGGRRPCKLSTPGIDHRKQGRHHRHPRRAPEDVSAPASRRRGGRPVNHDTAGTTRHSSRSAWPRLFTGLPESLRIRLRRWKAQDRRGSFLFTRQVGGPTCSSGLHRLRTAPYRPAAPPRGTRKGPQTAVAKNPDGLPATLEAEEAVKPKLVEAPGASWPFQLAFPKR